MSSQRSVVLGSLITVVPPLLIVSRIAGVPFWILIQLIWVSVPFAPPPPPCAAAAPLLNRRAMMPPSQLLIVLMGPTWTLAWKSPVTTLNRKGPSLPATAHVLPAASMYRTLVLAMHWLVAPDALSLPFRPSVAVVSGTSP